MDLDLQDEDQMKTIGLGVLLVVAAVSGWFAYSTQSEVDKLETWNQQWVEENERLNSTIDSLQTELNETEADYETLESDYEDLNQTHNETLELVEELRDENEELNQTVVELEGNITEFEELNSTAQMFENQNSKLEQILYELQQEGTNQTDGNTSVQN